MTQWRCSKWCILQEINHKCPPLTNSSHNSLGRDSCLKSPTLQFSIPPWIRWRQCNHSRANKQIPSWSQRSPYHPSSTSRRNSETWSGSGSPSYPRARWLAWWPTGGGCWPKSKSCSSSRSPRRTSEDTIANWPSSRRGNSLAGPSSLLQQLRPPPAQRGRPLTLPWRSMTV